MARSSEMNELKIVFLYDQFSCRREEDDPNDAILYFHPSSISIEKRVAICGQLMGITQFFTDMFSAPKIITLANGKFALRRFDDQYTLTVGCSSGTSDDLLEKEADILMSVIKFFHCDIKTILRNSNFDRDVVSTKLTSMMNHYIPVSQQHGDLFSLTFGILPILQLPKSANNISLQASVLLQTCMLKIGVLGGIVMYQNKVVGVELGQSLAQKLAFTQPYRMPPADFVSLDFTLPIGIQIFRVYITDAEYEELQRDCARFQNPQSYGYKLNSKPKKETTESVFKRPIEEEVTGKGEKLYSDVSSGIHSDETGHDSLLNSLNLEMKRDKSRLSHRLEDFNGYKPSPRRCQSVMDVYYSTEFGLDSQPQENDSIASHPNLVKKLGASVADPTFPYFTCDGRHSVSSAFQNSSSTELGDDEEVIQHELPSSHNPQQQITFTSSPVKVSAQGLGTPDPVPIALRRPIDLPLPQHKLSGTQRIKKKLWSTFNELLSPTAGADTQFDAFNDGPSKILVSDKSQNPDNTEIQGNPSNPVVKIPESTHLHLINSFRKLSSQEVGGLDEGGEGDGEYTSSSYANSISSELEHGPVTSASNVSQKSSQFSSPPPPPPPRKAASSPKVKKKATKSKQKGKDSKANEVPRNEVALYIYYDGSMRLLLLLEKEVEADKNLIESLWQYVSSSLVQLKVALSTAEEQSSFSHQSDPYCFLRYESIWKSMAHGGRNESMDFDTVQTMHHDFTRNPDITELIIRRDDHVVYGYQCVGSEVYYQQRAGLQPGLPMPSDLMGKVPLKAKRRLERDHSIFLL